MGFITQLAFGGTAVPVTYVNDTLVSNCTVVPYQFEPIAMMGGMVIFSCVGFFSILNASNLALVHWKCDCNSHHRINWHWIGVIVVGNL
jgi:hypothetical protein